MAKRKRSITQKVKDRRKKEGRGLGTGKDYKPELRIQDVSSIGLATRILGWKTGRIHHFMSKLELRFFYSLEWPEKVVDIREQFPLDLDETLAIANELGIRPPRDPRTKETVVMTTDFVVNERNGIKEDLRVYTVKYANKLASRRVMEKFEIERAYWIRRKAVWLIVTEKDIPVELVSNVEWIHSHRDLKNLAPVNPPTVDDVEAFLAPRWFSERLPLRTITDECDCALSLPSGASLAVVRHLIANRRVEVDMNKLIQPETIVPLISKPLILD